MHAEAFSRILAIDFSAAAVPTLGPNSLWVGEAVARGPIRTWNIATRYELAEWLLARCERPGRTLLVFDVALGWPVGFGAALGLVSSPHQQTVALLDDMIVDDERNVNNRFDVASELNDRCGRDLFWGHPPGRNYAHLRPTKSPRSPRDLRMIAEKRHIERAVGSVIQSPFQLSGVGAVGSQSLLAQVFLHRLQKRGLDLEWWPFSLAPTARVVAAESFFSLHPWRVERGVTPDEQQVRAAARWLCSELAAGRSPLRPELLGSLSHAQRQDVHAEEGWLAGFAAPPSPEEDVKPGED